MENKVIFIVIVITIVITLIPFFIRYRKRKAERKRILARQKELLKDYPYSQIFSDRFAKISCDNKNWGIINLETGDVFLSIMASDIEYTPYIAENTPFGIWFLAEIDNCKFMVSKKGALYQLSDKVLIEYITVLKNKDILENMSTHEIEPYDAYTLSFRLNAMAEIGNMANKFKWELTLLQYKLTMVQYCMVIYGEPEKYLSCFALDAEACEKLKNIAERLKHSAEKREAEEQS